MSFSSALKKFGLKVKLPGASLSLGHPEDESDDEDSDLHRHNKKRKLDLEVASMSYDPETGRSTAGTFQPYNP